MSTFFLTIFMPIANAIRAGFVISTIKLLVCHSELGGAPIILWG